VDRDGLDVGRLASVRRRVRVIYVTPSHQFPTGGVLSVTRRYGLLDWARERGAYVIEDDYDGEFRYTGRRIAALAALDPSGPILYCGTFAKALFPGLRMGFLSLPAELVEPVRHAKWLTDGGSSLIIQRMLAAVMATGEYERHIRRMTRRYRARRETLVGSIRQHFGGDAVVQGDGGGLHVVMWLPHLDRARMDDLIAGCAHHGVSVYPVAPHAASTLPHAGLLLGYGLVDADVIDVGISRVADVYRSLIERPPTNSASRRNG
jgi:GntR family transcriptional regulator/MocR family aminotransferase